MNNAYIRLLIYVYTSEKTSADYEIASILLKNFANFPDILIEDIANQSHTTPATVTKFAHKLGYQSFKELRCDCLGEEDNQMATHQLEIAKTSYEQACDVYLQEAKQQLDFYMHYHDHQQIYQLATYLIGTKEIGICYAFHAYPCVHVLRNYMEPFAITVQGVLRDVDEMILEQRMKESSLIFIVSLRGEWVKEHQNLMKKWVVQGKKVVLITAVYEEIFVSHTTMVIPFQFVGGTVLDSAQQIASLFVKMALAFANFPKVEKS